jgi:hypothetical protein
LYLAVALPEAEIIRIGKSDQEAENDDQGNNLDIVKGKNGSYRSRMLLVLNIIYLFLLNKKNHLAGNIKLFHFSAIPDELLRNWIIEKFWASLIRDFIACVLHPAVIELINVSLS